MGDSSLFGSVVFPGGNVVGSNLDVSGNTSIEGFAGEARDKSSKQIKKRRYCGVFIMLIGFG